MIEITIVSDSSLHLSSGHTVGPLSKTLSFITGATLRGALANCYVQTHQMDEQFESIFENDSNWFGPLWPVGSKKGYQVSPIPLSAYTCKLHPGFRNQDGHGVKDILLPTVSKQLSNHSLSCECGAALVPYSGFYHLDGRKNYLEKQCSKRFINRTAIDSRRETAASGQFFSLEVIDENQFFTGYIEFETEDLETNFIQKMNGIKTIRIGTAKTRGLGKVGIQELKKSSRTSLYDAEEEESLEDRLNKMTSRFHNGSSDCLSYFAVTFLTEGILTDEFLRFTGQLTTQYLANYIHPDFKHCKLIDFMAQMKKVDGWSNAHNLPKETRYAVDIGSVFFYGTTQKSEELLPALELLERVGVGQDRVQGFGKVVVNHPFHLNEVTL